MSKVKLKQQHVAIAYKLLRCRDTARKFFGDAAWRQKGGEWKPIIEAVMEKHKCELLDAAIIIGRQLEGFSLMVCLGVITDMMNDKEKH